jgi:hypothetical protein
MAAIDVMNLTVVHILHLSDVCRAFLQSKGVNSYRSGIVQCIAEKCNILMPGIYDDTLYPKDT